jgi:acetyltransferase-like isoleucine patch superfamily enzyme
MNTERVYQNVSFASDYQIGEFAIIGIPPRGYQDGELATTFGERVEIKSHAVIYAGNHFGDDCVLGHSLYMRHNNQVGNRVQIGAISVLESNIRIKDDVYIAPQAGIADYAILEEGVWIGSQTMFASVLHPLCPKIKECEKGAHFYRASMVGSNVTIYPDLRIGEGAFVEPGSVVVRDVRPFMVVLGNPAQEVGDIFTLYPGKLERLEQFLNLSSEAIALIRHQFESQTTLFPPR